MLTAVAFLSAISSGTSTAMLANHQSAVLVTGAPVTFPLKRRFSAMARCSGAALDHCQVLASLKSAEANKALHVAISLGV
jgi:hypothetical protein